MVMCNRRFGEEFAFACTLFAILCITFIGTFQARAQVSGATLTGTVTDPSGAVVPKAEIAVKGLATGVTREVVTDNAGFYSVPNLFPGSYEVSVTASGFSTLVRTSITLTVGAQQQLDISLQVGQISQTV